MNDFRFALRQLRKSPTFTMIAVFTLALGIGANTAIFSVINAVLLRPLPYPRADRIVTVKEASAGSEFFLSLPDYLDFRRDNTVFEQLAISRNWQQSLSAVPGRDPEQMTTASVTANFFAVIGITPQRGRTFSEEEDKPGAPPLVVISDRLWQRAFQRDPGILGQKITVDGVLRTVIGVMPPEMNAPGDADAWVSLMRNAKAWQNRGIHPLLLGWGRLKDGVSLERARAEMRALATRIEKEHPDTNDKITVALTPLLEMLVGSYRLNLELLLGAVTLVLLIACVNVANLFAARVTARDRDFAIRIALGANRAQIIRQVLIESMLISLLGGAAGLLIAIWSRDLLIALGPNSVARFHEVRFDAPVLAFTLVLTSLSTLLAGLWPAWQSSRAEVSLALKAGAHGSSETRTARRTRDWFVILEIALTLVLLSSAALILKSFAHVQAVSLGYDPHELLSARINLPSKIYSDRTKVMNFSRALLEEVRALPGVENVAVSSNPPLLAGWQIGFYHAGGPPPPPSQQFNAESEVVAADYFTTMKAALVRGRALNERDTANSPLVVVIDQVLAEQYFPGVNPIGKRIACDPDGDGNQNRLFEIVGVVAPMKFYGTEQALTFPVLYFSLAQVYRQQLVLLVRAKGNATGLARPIRNSVSAIDPQQPVFDVRTMSDRVSETWGTQRLLSFLLGLFAVLALTLATVGLYGAIAFTTLRRLREIGVRLALGAPRAHIRVLIFSHGFRLLVIGVLFGLLGAVMASRLLHSFLFNVSATDATVYLVVSLVLAAATVLASWLPSRRAARVDPIVVLRAE